MDPEVKGNVPVVVVHRNLMLDKLAANQTVFHVKDFQLDTGQKEDLAEANTSDRHLLSSSAEKSSFEDFEDELPPCAALLASSKHFENSVAERKTSFSEIFESITKQKEYIATNQKLKEDLEAFINNEVALEASKPSDILKENDLDIDDTDEELYLKNIEEFMGEPIIDLSRRGKIFTTSQLTLKSMQSPTSAVDKFIMGLSAESIAELIKARTFELQFSKVTDKQTALRFIFHLMSIHDDYFVVTACKDFLLNAFKNDPSTCKAIGLQEIFESLLNLGITLENLVPIPELLIAARNIVSEVVNVNVRNDNNQVSNEEAGLDIMQFRLHGLKFVISVLQTLVIARSGRGMDDPEHLTVLLIALCRLSLDSILINEDVLIDIQITIDEILQVFKLEEWPQRVVLLTQYLCSLSEIPQSLTSIARLFYLSERGHHLQRLTSFFMLHKVLGHDPPNGLGDVQPKTVLNFLNSIDSWKSYDRCTQYTSITFIHMSVGMNFIQGNWKIYKDLSILIHKISKGMKCGLDDMTYKKIEELTTNMHAMWSMSADLAPASHKTMFSYLPSSDDPA